MRILDSREERDLSGAIGAAEISLAGADDAKEARMLLTSTVGHDSDKER